MSPEAERNLECLYRHQTEKVRVAETLVFKILPFVGIFFFLACLFDFLERNFKAR